MPLGGAKRTLFEEVKYLSKEHNVDVYQLSDNEKFLDITAYSQGIYNYPFNLVSKLPSFLDRLQKDYKKFISLRFLHRSVANDIACKNYDVALVHGDRFTQAPYILRYLKIPSLYFCQEYLRIAYEKVLKFEGDVNLINKAYECLTRLLRKKIDADNAKCATIIVANSEFTRKNIKKAYGVNAEVCHLGVDTGVFKPIKGKRKNRIIFIGERNKINGLDLLEKALKLLPKIDKPKLEIVGSSSGKLKIRDDKELARYYSLSLVTICTSYNEPFGLPPIESMACKTPVIAVNEGGYRETIENGKTGFLVKRNKKILAEKLMSLIGNKKALEYMGRMGRRSALKKWRWIYHNKKIEQFLYKLNI